MAITAVELKIESFGGLGDGIGSYEGKPVFIPKSVIGDRLKVKIIAQTADAWRGEIIEILEAGEGRVEAPCPHFSSCGGCSLQQLEKLQYRSFKEKIVANILGKLNLPDFVAEMVFLAPDSRRRAEFRLHKDDGRWSLAYLGNRSHNKVAISSCIILDKDLQKRLPLLQEAVNKISFAENIELVKLTYVSGGLEVVFILSGKIKDKKLVTLINHEMSLVAVSVGAARALVLDDSGRIIAKIEEQPLKMKIGGIDMDLPPASFLQATGEGQRLLTEFVINSLLGSGNICDLFCGIGSYSLPLAEKAHVYAADEDKSMIENLKKTAKIYNMPIIAERRNLFVKPLTAAELKKYDSLAVNPPRAGAKAQCEQIAKSQLNNVVMVSCNPASFVRDALILRNSGFKLQKMLAIDQFVWSPHLEIAAYFVR